MSNGVTPGSYKHAEGDEWTITSHTPVDRSLLEVDVLDIALPGKLGTYILPKDAVFFYPSLACTGQREERCYARKNANLGWRSCPE